MTTRKPKRGRPVKAKQDRAALWLRLRVTASELRDIRAAAKRAGSTLSAFVRETLANSIR